MPTLTWLTRDRDLKSSQHAPYRLLEAVPELSAGDADSGNMLIQGDNLDALKALLPYYAGQVKCIYINPPITPVPPLPIICCSTAFWGTSDPTAGMC